jgi:hypothetical protein
MYSPCKTHTHTHTRIYIYIYNIHTTLCTVTRGMNGLILVGSNQEECPKRDDAQFGLLFSKSTNSKNEYQVSSDIGGMYDHFTTNFNFFYGLAKG